MFIVDEIESALEWGNTSSTGRNRREIATMLPANPGILIMLRLVAIMVPSAIARAFIIIM